MLIALVILAAPAVPAIVDAYVARTFETYPSFSTQAGKHDRDGEMENLSPARLEAWLAFNRATLRDVEAALKQPNLSRDDAFDAEALQGRLQREILTLAVLQRPRRDPTWWTG